VIGSALTSARSPAPAWDGVRDRLQRAAH